MREYYKKYGKYINLTFFYLLFFAFVFYVGITNKEIENETEKIVCAICDAFTVPGIIFFGIGVITWVSSKGTFDSFGYMLSNFSIRNIVGTFGKKPKDNYDSFYEYKCAKDERGRTWLKHYFIFGLVSLVIGAVLLIVYYAVAA